MRVNQLLHDDKFFIADHLDDFIEEMSKHCYKDGDKDGEVLKENDDLMDAMRYTVFGLKPDKEEIEMDKKYRKHFLKNSFSLW